MPRYKPDLSGQSQLVPVDFVKQVLPGTFEHALVHLIDHKLDCSAFDSRYCNDATGATAYDGTGNGISRRPNRTAMTVIGGYDDAWRRVPVSCVTGYRVMTTW